MMDTPIDMYRGDRRLVVFRVRDGLGRAFYLCDLTPEDPSIGTSDYVGMLSEGGRQQPIHHWDSLNTGARSEAQKTADYYNRAIMHTRMEDEKREAVETSLTRNIHIKLFGELPPD